MLLDFNIYIVSKVCPVDCHLQATNYKAKLFVILCDLFHVVVAAGNFHLAAIAGALGNLLA